eukprot:TRINITY_DN7231_c0_g1_i1.p1 TRINITY_DN7231_c0_g1~~TRINITY_DN7231_c0_g1_i1.p1  ORF type:complete len:142 (+),score=25.13 TRINITY_DN7231_c0_g1_i1:700-1125(+)
MVIVNPEESDDDSEEERSKTHLSYKNLYDAEKIATLATDGKQPLLQILAKNFKLLTSNIEFSQTHIDFLTSTLYKSLYKLAISEDLTNYNAKFSRNYSEVDEEKGRKALVDSFKRRAGKSKDTVAKVIELLKKRHLSLPDR